MHSSTDIISSLDTSNAFFCVLNSLKSSGSMSQTSVVFLSFGLFCFSSFLASQHRQRLSQTPSLPRLQPLRYTPAVISSGVNNGQHTGIIIHGPLSVHTFVSPFGFESLLSFVPLDFWFLFPCDELTLIVWKKDVHIKVISTSIVRAGSAMRAQQHNPHWRPCTISKNPHW